MENEIEFEKLMDSIGALAEMCFLMYRSAVDAGASEGEAFRIVHAFFAAFLDKSMND